MAGYGQLTTAEPDRLAHRISYQIYRGVIPENLLVLHICDVRCCVNPNHLYVGTHADNSRDKCERNDSLTEPRLYTRRFDESTEAEIRNLALSGRKLRDIARQFGCSLYLVWSISKSNRS